MIDPNRVHMLYRAVNLHFTTKYDIFQYGGKCTVGSISKRSEPIIMRLSKRFTLTSDVVQYLVAQHLYGGNIFERSMADEYYDRWMKFKIASTQIIIDELHERDIDVITMGDAPQIFHLINFGEVGIETAAALNNLTDFATGKNYFLFEKNCRIINKLRRFIKFDEDRVVMELELHKYHCYKKHDTSVANLAT